jgi:hypothetical protein
MSQPTMGQRKRSYQVLMAALMEEIKAGLDREVAAQRGVEIFESCFGDRPLREKLK